MARHPGPQRPKKKGLSSTDLRAHLRLAETRKKVLRDLKDERKHVGADAVTYKIVMTCLFSALITSGHDEGIAAREFFLATRHLFDGGALATMPLRLIERQKFLRKVEAVLHGKASILDDEDEDKEQA